MVVVVFALEALLPGVSQVTAQQGLCLYSARSQCGVISPAPIATTLASEIQGPQPSAKMSMQLAALA